VSKKSGAIQLVFDKSITIYCLSCRWMGRAAGDCRNYLVE